MAVNNYMCVNCASEFVCKIKDILKKFDSDAKNNLGVDIQMESCVHLEPVEESDSKEDS